MIYQKCPRRGYNIALDKNKGFYIEGIDRSDCLNQLKEWCNSNKEKWVYFYNMGMGPSYPVPVAKNVIEVAISDKEPASLMFMWTLFQKGSENRREIDEMSEEQKLDIRKKQLEFFYMIGKSFEGRNKKK